MFTNSFPSSKPDMPRSVPKWVTYMVTRLGTEYGNTPSTFKINILSTTNSINYNSENNAFVQDIILPKTTNLNELSICFYDRYNNIINNNNNDISFSLGFEF